MDTTLTSICIGSPRFADPDDAALEPAQAWRSLISRVGVAAAASQVGGDFAVALPLDDGSVFIAVDRFAIRTLCWRIEGGSLRFAERADELAAGASLSPQAMYDYLYFHVVPSPRTVFDGVQRLPAAHWGLFKDGRLTPQRYWTPAFKPRREPDFEALRAEFRRLLQDAVARQLDGSTPACYLSGGTDSSTIAGMIGLAAGRPAVAYSIGFAAQGYDEMEYARLAAKHFGCEHREIYFSPEDLVRDIPKVAAWYDQPFGNSSALPAFHCAERARADGITRLLAGDGGDELFGGNSRYATDRLFEPYARIPALIRRGFLEPFFGLGIVSSLPGLRKGSNYIRLANLGMPERGQDYNHVRRIGESTALTRDFVAAIEPADAVRQQRAVWAEAECTDGIDRHLAYDWRYTLAECDLPKVVGTSTMAGVSVGFPMLDDALVDFSMTLPADYKLRGDALRWFFKEALRGFLPDGVITKKKQGFGLPFGVWMVQHEGLRRLSVDAVSSLVARGIVRPDFESQLFDRLLPDHPHYYGTMVWILVMLEHWLRSHAPNWRQPA